MDNNKLLLDMKQRRRLKTKPAKSETKVTGISRILCPNCGKRLLVGDQFCPQCGQKNQDLHIPISHLLHDTVEDFFHFDGKSIRTLLLLTFKPGLLTKEFMIGRRIRYVTPIRLYVFISFIFFLLLGLSGIRQEKQEDEGIRAPSLSFYGISSQSLYGLTSAQIDSVIQKNNIEPTLINKYFLHQMARTGSTGGDEFKHLLSKVLSYMMFALMPIFAFFVYILHRRNKPRYLYTLIFSVHFHCFMFLFFILWLFFYRLLDFSELILATPLLFPVYLFFAFRRVYGNTRLMTALKVAIIGFLHTVSLIILFLITVVISILIY